MEGSHLTQIHGYLMIMITKTIKHNGSAQTYGSVMPQIPEMATLPDSTPAAAPILEERKKRSIYSDTGIANTVANVQTLAETIDLFEPEYDSNNPLHTVPHLVIMYTQAKMHLSKVAGKVSENKVEIDNRHLLFVDLPKFATRLINAIVACGASKDTTKNARYFVNKINGNRVVKIDPDEEDKKHISVSQQSYVQQVEHFEGLYLIAQNEPLYDPTSADLKLTALGTKLEDLTLANKEVTKSQAVLKVARMDRNAYFNNPVTGLVDVCLDTKNNVKAIFGATSAQYLMISGLRFLRIKTK